MYPNLHLLLFFFILASKLQSIKTLVFICEFIFLKKNIASLILKNHIQTKYLAVYGTKVRTIFLKENNAKFHLFFIMGALLLLYEFITSKCTVNLPSILNLKCRI